MGLKKPGPEAFHPGEYVRDELFARRWSEVHLMEKSHLTWREVVRLVHGECPVTSRMAKALGKAFGTGSEVWLNLQKGYDAIKAIKGTEKKR